MTIDNGSGNDETKRRIGSSISIQRFIPIKHQSVENTFPKIDLLSLSINERVIVVVVESLIVFVERLDTD